MLIKRGREAKALQADTPAKAARLAWPHDGCCANCTTALLGPWCYGCGQRAHDHHRSLRHLTSEAIEGLTHADGRLWRTLFLLAAHPGRLTNDYLNGKRVAEIPPLRLFFVALLLVFGFGALLGHPHLGAISPSEGQTMAQAHAAIAKLSLGNVPRLNLWLRTHLERALDNPNGLLAAMNDWAERFALLLLPLSAISLRLLFPWRGDMKLYDHLIFTMHSLSFAGFVWVAYMAALKLLHLAHADLLFWALPVHLFTHMRGVYRTGVISTLWHMLCLAICTCGVFAILLAGLSLVSLGMLENAA